MKINVYYFLDFREKESPEKTSPTLFPWFAAPFRVKTSFPIVFGHWSSLKMTQEDKIKYNVYPVDTGAVWQGTLTALRLEDFKTFTTAKTVDH